MSLILPKKLGKLEPALDARNLLLEDYLTAPLLPALKPAADWPLPNPPLPAWGNDRAGCCVLAAVASAIASWTASAKGQPAIIANQAVLDQYSELTGYNQETGSSDTGLVMLDVLKLWRRAGLFGHEIVGFVAVNPRHHDHVMYAVQLFNCLLTGAALPRAAESQFDHAQEWLAPARAWGQYAPGSWGGHAFNVTADGPDALSCRTWTRLQPCSWHWWDTYVDECYAILTKDWVNAQGKSPDGFDVEALLDDLGEL